MKFVKILDTKNQWILADQDLLDNYLFGDKIGEGQYGSIYMGYDKINRTQVAIKKIKIKRTQSIENLIYEITILKHLSDNLYDHPNVLNYKASLLEEENGMKTIYIITNYIQGVDLYSIYQDQKHDMTVSQVWNFIKQLIQTVKLLHTHNIAHRDLKLDNIMYNNDIYTIIDFGSAKLHELKSKKMVGTPIYLPPEWYIDNANFEEHDFYKYDIWAIGVVMYEFIHKKPHIQENVASIEDVKNVYLKMINNNILYIQSFYPNEQINYIISSCLTINSAKRLTVKELDNYLEKMNLS